MRKDRRLSKRYPLQISIRFRIFLPSSPETASSWLSGEIRDISDSGIRFFTNTVRNKGLHFFHPDTVTNEQSQVEVEIATEQPPLTLLGQVIWYDRNTEDHPFSFQAGMKFLSPPRDLKKQLLQLTQQPLPSS